jgi:hypothetical protein
LDAKRGKTPWIYLRKLPSLSKRKFGRNTDIDIDIDVTVRIENFDIPKLIQDEVLGKVEKGHCGRMEGSVYRFWETQENHLADP